MALTSSSMPVRALFRSNISCWHIPLLFQGSLFLVIIDYNRFIGVYINDRTGRTLSFILFSLSVLHYCWYGLRSLGNSGKIYSVQMHKIFTAKGIETFYWNFASKCFFKVLEYVDDHGNEVLNLGSFTLLPQHVVRLILNREELKADEFSKFQVFMNKTRPLV